jgi:hypothetical protein
MRQNLEANEIDPEDIPLVFQYNKRDLPNALPLEIINERMNPRAHPYYEAVAVKGTGVEETLKGVTKLVFKALSARYGTETGVASAAAPGPVPPAVPPPAAAPPAVAAAPPAIAAAPPAVAVPPPGAPAPPGTDPPAPRPPGATATIPPGSSRRPLQSPEDLLEEIDLEPAPELEAPPPAPEPKTNPRTTLVSAKKETEDLRRRIGMPAELDVSLEEIEDEGDDLEEITFDESPSLAPPRPFPSRVPPRPAPGNSPGPFTVEISPGQTEATVPIEIALDPNGGPVTLNLRLVLKPKS